MYAISDQTGERFVMAGMDVIQGSTPQSFALADATAAGAAASEIAATTAATAATATKRES